MKIGIVIDRLNVGGVEKIAIEQVRALREINQDAYLVVLREKAVVENAFADLLEGIPIVYLDSRLPKIFRFSFQFPIFHFFSLFHLTYPLFIPFVVKKNEFDYFIVHGTYTSITAVTLKKIKQIGFSAFIWDPASYILDRVYSSTTSKPLFWLMKKTAYIFDKFLINNMDNVLVGGAAHNKFIKKMNPQKNIKIIYPSVHPINKPTKKENYVQMATAWKRGKNPEYIVELAKTIPNIHIKMVGKWLDPEYQKEFLALLNENGLDKQVEVVGEVSEKQLSQSFSRALVVLQTNDDRGFGMPALEAAGHATTFIIPQGQGVCELFMNGKDGFYTKEKETKEIARILGILHNDPKRAVDMGISAWEKVMKEYSWQKHAQKLLNLANSMTKIKR
ncbi:MAG: hypothetical protein QG570_353 [Patescibacteria group bacterium]|nr:hypothetical protein [Patescibacteria group bacterium]